MKMHHSKIKNLTRVETTGGLLIAYVGNKIKHSFAYVPENKKLKDFKLAMHNVRNGIDDSDKTKVLMIHQIKIDCLKFTNNLI